MPTDSVLCWESDLRIVLRRRARVWMRGPLRPRVAVLPRLWGGYGAWTLFTLIFVTRRQLTCPDHVRRYLLSHEVAHIWAGHVYLQALFAGSYLLLMTGPVSHPIIKGMALTLTTVAYLCFIMPRFHLAPEYAADSVAVELNGAYPTLLSSLWMAQRVKDIETAQRQARLKRLRGLIQGAACNGGAEV